MHTSTTMKTAEFGFTTMSGPASFDEAFGWFSTDERVGVVVAEPGDGILAAPLVLAAIGAFYEKLRESGDDFYLYPDVFMFHMENLHGGGSTVFGISRTPGDFGGPKVQLSH
jgi:hypothetical protein